MALKSRETRDRRWDLRVAESEDALIRAASRSTETSYTSFVREAALAEARRILADRTVFALDPDAWERFSELLDRPPQVPPGLRDLYSHRSAFE